MAGEHWLVAVLTGFETGENLYRALEGINK